MPSASAIRSLSRLASRQVLLAVVVVLLAMVALALLAEAMSGGGGTVYLAEIQPAARSGAVPSLVTVGYGQASAPADRADVQLLFAERDDYGGGPMLAPTPGATPGAVERAAAEPIVAALQANGLPADAIRVVTSAAFSPGYFVSPNSLMFRVDLDIADPELDVVTGLIDSAAQAAAEGGYRLIQAGARYAVADCGPLRARAWEAAVADARARAVAQAAQLGVELGDLFVAQESPDTEQLFDVTAAEAQTDTIGCVSNAGRAADALGGSSTVTVPLFDPAAPPVAVVGVRVNLAFEIVGD